MIITSTEIREKLKGVWSELRFVILSDRSWDVSDFEDAKAWNDRISKPKFKKNVFECEEQAYWFMAEQRRLDSEDWDGQGEKYNRPLFTVFMDRYHGKGMDHVANLWFLSDHGLMLMERKTDEFWKPEWGKDNVYIFIS